MTIQYVQSINRKQFIEYKLKLASRISNNGDTVGSGNTISPADRALMITELTELQGSIDSAIKTYERKYNESFNKPVSAAVPMNNALATYHSSATNLPHDEVTPNRGSMLGSSRSYR